MDIAQYQGQRNAMSADAVRDHITTLPEVAAQDVGGDSFFTYDPNGDLPTDRWLPFATLVTGDNHDTVSRLGEPGAYRLNIGLTRATYTERFGAAPTDRDEHGVLDSGYDYATRDLLLPHPHYASQHWVCVVNPSVATFDQIRPLLAEAYDFAVRKYANHRSRVSGT